MTIASDTLDAIVARTATPPPFVTALKIPAIDGWEPGRVWGTWTVDPETHHAAGAVFGGYIAAVADSFVGLAMFSTMVDGEWFTTSDLRVSFFRPIIDGTIDVVAEVVHRSRRQGHVEAMFVNGKDKPVAKAVATQVVIPAADGAG